jgi:hypothetical protein
MKTIGLSTALIGALAALAGAALSQPAPVPAPNMPDGRSADELKAGAPPEGAPIAKGVPKGPGSLTGVWYNDKFRSSAKFAPPDLVGRTKAGDLPPMLPWAAALQLKRYQDALAGHPYATSKSRCMPAGLPMSMLSPGTLGLKIIEEPRMVTVLIEELNNYRQIRLNAPQPPADDIDPSYLGHSVAKWEGDTLVVDTIGFNDQTTLDMLGLPHTDALHVTERMRRISMDRLEIQTTIDDPKTFTHPWQWPRRTLKLAPDGDLKEYLCANQRNGSVNGVTTVTMPGAH